MLSINTPRHNIFLLRRDVSFDTDVWVSVFETNIRVLGGLVSAHVLAVHVQRAYGAVPWYRDQLLLMATDLATRLLPAFNTSTGIPYPRWVQNTSTGIRDGGSVLVKIGIFWSIGIGIGIGWIEKTVLVSVGLKNTVSVKIIRIPHL